MGSNRTRTSEKRTRTDSIGASAAFFILYAAIMILNAIVLDRVGAPLLAIGLTSFAIAASAFIMAQRAMWTGGFSESREILRPAILSALVYFALLALAEWGARTLNFPTLYWVESGLSIVVFFGLYKSFQT